MAVHAFVNRVSMSFSVDETLLPRYVNLSTSLRGVPSSVEKTAGEEARRQLHKNAASNLEQVLAATPHKTPTIRPPTSYHENYPS